MKLVPLQQDKFLKPLSVPEYIIKFKFREQCIAKFFCEFAVNKKTSTD